MSSSCYVILVRHRETDKIKAVPNMTLYDLEGAKEVLKTVRAGYNWKDCDDYSIEIYQPHWEPIS